MNYRKILPGDPCYPRIAACRDAGAWICDSLDHNDDPGCSNPGCFKYEARAAEYAQFLIEEFVDVMRARGHEIQFINDEILVRTV